MTDKERIRELEIQLHVQEGLVKLLKEIAFTQRDTINQLRDRISQLTPDTIA